MIEEFLDVIEEKNQLRYDKRKSVSDYKIIYKKTKKQIKVTRKLLKENNKKLKNKKIKKAILFRHLS